jgi:hypothetical protein
MASSMAAACCNCSSRLSRKHRCESRFCSRFRSLWAPGDAVDLGRDSLCLAFGILRLESTAEILDRWIEVCKGMSSSSKASETGGRVVQDAYWSEGVLRHWQGQVMS